MISECRQFLQLMEKFHTSFKENIGENMLLSTDDFFSHRAEAVKKEHELYMSR
jgi:hypothetical protein